MISYLEHDDNFIYVKGTTREVSKLNGQYLESKKAFRVPITYTSALEVLEATGNNSNDLMVLVHQEKEKYDTALNIKKKEDTKGNESLRPYQRVDVEFIKSQRNVAIFNEQRTGKTPTILKAVQEYLGQGIVVCPAGLKLNWQREFQKWVDDTTPTYVVSGTKSKRFKMYEDFANQKVKMLFMSYETLRVDLESIMFLLNSIDVLIIDEAHRLRNFQTRQSKALYTLSGLAKHIYPMTGTPAVNHPSDVFGILKLLNPKKFTSFWQFVDRYFGYVEGRFGRELLDVRKDKLDEFTQLLEMTSVQRKRKEVMSWIPKIQHRSVHLEMDKKQLKHYKQVMDEYMYGENIIPNAMAQLTRFRQLCLDPGLLDLDGASPKTEFIKEFIDDNDGSMVIFSSFTSYLKKLHTLIPGSVLLTGEQTQEQKQAAVDAIQAGRAKVLLANIIAGGTGWTLDNIDTVIFTDRSFNPVDNDQAEDRIVPTDPDKTYGAKQIIDLVMENTVDVKITQMLIEKINLIKIVNEYGLNSIVDLGEKENNNNARVRNKR